MNGVNKVVYTLAHEQKKAGWQVQVWGISDSLEHNYPPRNFDTRLFKKAGFPFSTPEGMREAILNSNEGTVFHLHGGFIPVFWNLSGILQSANRPFIFTPHGSYNILAWKKGWWRKQFYFRIFEQNMLRKAACIHVLGQSEISGLGSLIEGLPVSRIPYGFSVNPSKPLTNHRKAPLFGYCGRIDPFTKGLDVLFPAFAKTLKRNPEARLWIIGDGPERHRLELLCETLGINHAVHFYGSRYGEEKDNLLAQLDVFVHPSRNEGLPTAVLEAASLGVPGLISEATNLGEDIREAQAGWVISNTEVNELAATMSGICLGFKGQEMENIRSNARRMIQEQFNWKRILNEFHQVYQNALPS